MTEPTTEEKTSSMTHSSGYVSKSQPSPSMRDWSLLPEELLHLIPKYLEDEENCFDVVHARSVCSSWRSTFPFPSCLLRTSYSLPSFAQSLTEGKDFCTLEKIPLFLVRARAPPLATVSEFFLGGIGRDNSEDRMELSSPLECSVKVKIPRTDPTSMKLLGCQILSLGHQYRMTGLKKPYKGMAFLPLNNERGGEYVLLLNYTEVLLVLRSTEMKWMRLNRLSDASCRDVFAFRGKFYAHFLDGGIFIIDPLSLEETPLIPPLELPDTGSCSDLVPCGNDELFLVEKIIPRGDDILDFGGLVCRVSKLDEEAGKWVEVSDLGDCVLFIRNQGNVSCSAKELPDDCGLSGNSVLSTNEPGNITYPYKHGVPTDNIEDHLNFWRFSREYRVRILNKSPPVVAFRVMR